MRACQGESGQLPTHLLTFLGICSLLDLGCGGIGGDLGQEGEEAEEQAGPPERHAAAAGLRLLLPAWAWVTEHWRLGPSGES